MIAFKRHNGHSKKNEYLKSNGQRYEGKWSKKNIYIKQS
jgi:hypothetical protein